jgi:hypothetical protein
MEIAPLIAPAITGLISGTLASLVAPWVGWGIESKRERMKARRALLEEARTALADPPTIAAFRRMPLYSKIRHLLTNETNEYIAGKFDERGNEVILIVRGGAHGGIHPYAHKVLDELSRIEREWGLV